MALPHNWMCLSFAKWEISRAFMASRVQSVGPHPEVLGPKA